MLLLNTHAWYYKPLLVLLKPLRNRLVWCVLITSARVGTNTSQYVTASFIDPIEAYRYQRKP